MTIRPLKNQLYLKVEKPKAGVLDLSARPTAIEFAEVISVGEGIENIKPGDKVFVKAWAIDIVNYNEQMFYFCNLDTNGVLATIEE